MVDPMAPIGPRAWLQYRDTAFGFEPDSELHSCLLFFEALVPVLPGLAISVIPDTRRPLLVYTDASFYTKRKRRRSDGGECPADHWKSLRGGLGAVVIDPETSEAWFAAADPPWALLASSWQSDRKTYIAELEALAAISVYSTYPGLFVGRKVNHFIDNTVAQSALVHGYAKKPDLAKSVNVFYLQMMSLRASVYFDWVPSKDNIADLPSRYAYDETKYELSHHTLRGGLPDVLRVPSVAEWGGPLRAWTEQRRFEGLRVEGLPL